MNQDVASSATTNPPSQTAPGLSKRTALIADLSEKDEANTEGGVGGSFTRWKFTAR
jgi:hypothetical protein